MQNPNDNDAPELQALALVAIIGALPDGPTKSWFSTGVAAWLSGSPLETALGLAGGQGRRTARTVYRRHLRDEALRQAHGMMPGKSPWARSFELSRECQKFQSVILPRWRNLEGPPAGASELRTILWRVFRAGNPPTSVSRIHDVCSCETPLFIGRSSAHPDPAG